MKFIKFFQYAYLFFAVLFLYDTFTNWNVNRSRAYISLLLGATAVFMYFFKKRFNKKFENKDQPK